MNPRRWTRLILDEVKSSGLNVVSVSQSKHLKIRVSNTGGEERTIIAPVTPSDRRVLMNIKADIKRLAEGLGIGGRREQ